MQQVNGGESCVLQAVLQGNCTSVLVETEKNALRCNYFSVWSNWERATLVQEPQSVSQEKIDKFVVSRIFCLYSIVALECFCGLPVQISHVCQ